MATPTELCLGHSVSLGDSDLDNLICQLEQQGNRVHAEICAGLIENEIASGRYIPGYVEALTSQQRECLRCAGEPVVGGLLDIK